MERSLTDEPAAVPMNSPAITKRTTRLAIFLLAVLLTACGQQPRTTGVDGAATPAQHKHGRALVYRIDPQQSSIVLKVYRDGPLARFGHNHVVAVAGLSGALYRQKDLAQSSFDLSIPVAQLLLDRPADRSAAGADFSGELSEFAIAGTRENMLGPKLLAAEQYPDIKLESVAMDGTPPDVRFTVKVTVRGIESQIVIPASLELSEKLVVAKGQFSLTQTQLGLTPFSVLGGGLRVRDNIDADYHLVAVRAE